MSGKIASLLIEIGMKVDGALRVESNLKSIQGEARKVGDASDSAAGRAGKAFASLGGGLRTVAKLAAGAAVAFAGIAVGAFEFVKSQTSAIGATTRMAKQLGINVVELQRLKWAAKFSGLSDDSLASGMKRFNATLFDLEHSSGGVKGKGASAALKEIGLELADLKGKSRTDQLGIIADHLNRVEDGATRSAIAAKLFGKTAGPEMLGLLAKGSEGINKLAADAQGVFTPEQAAQAAEFNSTMKAIGAEVDALKMEVALDLLPTVQEVVSSIKDWIRENREWLKQKVHEGVAKFTQFVKEAWPIVKNLATTIGELAQSLGGEGGGLGKVLSDLQPVGQLLIKVFEELALGLKTVARGIRAIFDETYSFKNMVDDTDADVDEFFNHTKQKALEAAKAVKELRSANAPSQADLDKIKSILAEPQHADTGPVGQYSLGGGEMSAKEAAAYLGAAKASKKKEARAARVARGESAAEPKQQKAASGVTVEEVIDAMVHGGSPALSQRIMSNLAAHTPRAEDIKPTVAITNINNNVQVTQHIKSTDPLGAGSESAQAFKDVLGRSTAKAAQSLGSNVVR